MSRYLKIFIVFLLFPLFSCNDMIVNNEEIPIPTNVQASTSHTDRITVTWDCSSSASRFIVYRAESSETSGSDYTKIAEVYARTYDDKDNSLVPGKTYYYRISSYTSTVSQKSELVGIGNLLVSPLENVTATTDQKYKIVVSWDLVASLKSSAIDGYATIFYSDNLNSITSDKKEIISLKDLGASYELSDVTIGQNYYIRTKVSVKSVGTSDLNLNHSSITSAVTGKTAISSPRSVTASKGTNTKGVEIHWDEVVGASGYAVKRDATNYSTLIKEIWKNDTALFNNRIYIDTSVIRGQTYRYAVLAIFGNNNDYTDLYGEDLDKENSIGQKLNSGYANYPTAVNDSVSTNIAGKVVLRYNIDVLNFSNVCAQLYRRDYTGTTSGSQSPVGSKVDVTGSPFIVEDASAMPGKKYWYSVKIYRESGADTLGMSNYSNEVVGYCPLGTPQNLTATDGTLSENITVKWNKVNGAKTYYVYIGADSVSMTSPGTTTDTFYTFFNSRYQSGKIYYFKVKAFSSVASEFSNIDSGWMRINAPSRLNFSERLTTSLGFSWGSVKNAQSYVIERKVGNSSYGILDTVDAPITSYTDTALISGEKYSYRLQTIGNLLLPSTGKEEISELSDTLSSRTLLETPTLDSVSRDLDGKIIVYWSSSPSVSGVKYKVYRQADGGGFSDFAITSNYQCEITDASLLVPGKVYSFCVSAFFEVESNRSAIKNGFTKLNSAYDLTATDGTISDTVQLNWKTILNSGVEQFHIMRSKEGENDFLRVGSLSSSDTSATTTTYKEYVYNDAYSLEGGQKYEYKIQSYRSDYIGQAGVSEIFSNVDIGRIKILPPTLHEVSCGSDSGKITLIFENLASVNSYLCYYSTSNDFSNANSISIARTGVSSHTESKGKYTIDDINTIGLKDGQLCYFKMAAIIGNEESAKSETKPGFSRPVKPVISSQGSKGTLPHINFAWNSVSNPDSIRYEILRIKNSDYSKDTLFTTNTFYNDSAVITGAKYVYRCRVVDLKALEACKLYYPAFNTSSVYSAYSDTTSGFVRIGEIDSIYASMDKKDSVLVTWRPLKGDVYYDVMRTPVYSINWDTVINSLNTNSCIDSRIYENERGLSYYYKVKAYSRDYPDIFSYSDSTQGQMLLLPPQNVVASKGEYGDSIKVSWTPVAYATSYEARRVDYSGRTSDFNLNSVATASQGYFFNSSDIVKGEGYVYLIKANMGYDMGSTEYSDISTFALKNSATGYTKLPKVLNVNATEGTYRDSIKISWGSVNVASSYSLYCYYQGALKSNFTSSDTVYIHTRSSGLKDGEIYKYVVVAKKGIIESLAPSDSDSGYLKLLGPVGVEASKGFSDSIVISWDTLTATPVNSYSVYRDNNPNVAIGTVQHPTKSFSYKSIAPAEKGATLGFYVVASTPAFGLTASSDVAKGHCLVDTVTNFTVTETNVGLATHGAKLSWDSPGGADSVRIQVKTSTIWENLVVLPKSTNTTTYIDTDRKVGINIQYRAQGIRTVDGVERNSKFVYNNIVLTIPTISFDTISRGDYLSYVYLTWKSLPTNDEANFQVFVFTDTASYNSGIAFDTITVVESGKSSYAFQHSANTAANRFVRGTKYFYRLRTQTVSGGVWSELSPTSQSVYCGWTRTPAPILDSVVSSSVGVLTAYWRNESSARSNIVKYTGVNNSFTSEVNNIESKRVSGNIFSGQNYTFTVKAINGTLGDTSDWSNAVVGVAQVGAPDVFSATDGSKVDTVQLSWEVRVNSPNYGAEKYTVERGLDTSNFSVIKTVEDNSWNTHSGDVTLTYNDVLSNSELGKMYYYRIYAKGGFGSSSGPSTIDSGWAKIPAPEITGYTGYNGSLPLEVDSIRVTWTDPCQLRSSSVEYHLLYTVGGIAKHDTVYSGTNSHSFEVSGIDRYQGISVRMYSERDAFGKSLETDTMFTYTILPVLDKAEIITGLTATDTGVSINYKGTHSWVDSIVFLRKEENTSTSTRIEQVVNPGVSTVARYDDKKGLIINTVYAYKFKLYSKYAGYSVESDTVLVKTKIIPPEDLSASKGTSTGEVSLTWTAVPSGGKTISYNVYADTSYNDFVVAATNSNKMISTTTSTIAKSLASFTVNTQLNSWLTLKRGRKYYFAITTNGTESYVANSISIPSKVDSGYISITNPVMDSVSKGAYSDSIITRWKACDAYEHDTYMKYRLYWYYPGGPPYSKLLSSSDYSYDGTYVSYTLPRIEGGFTNLEAKKEYFFTVRGVMSASASTFADSSEISENSLSGWLALEKPQNFEANYNNGFYPDKIQLRWINPNNFAVRIYGSDNRATLWDNFLYSLGEGTTTYDFPVDSDTSRGVYKYFGARFYDQTFGLSNTADVGCQDSGIAQLGTVNITSASQADYLDSIMVYWDSLPNGDQYQVIVEDTLGTVVHTYNWASYSKFNQVFKETNLVRGKKYKFKVRAKNSAIAEASVIGDYQSTGVSGFTQLPEIVNVNASDGTFADKIRIKWGAIAEAQEYIIYRSEDTASIGSVIATVAEDSCDDVSSLMYGKDYYYRVLGVNSWIKGLGDSKKNYSDLDTGWKKLPIVTNINASKGTLEGKILVSWDQLSRVGGYYVDTCSRGTSNWGTLETRNSANIDRVHYYESDGLERGKWYHFKVRAFTENRSNSLSEIEADSGYMSLGKVQNVRASKGVYKDSIRVIFNKVTGFRNEENYEMQRYSVSKSDTTDVTSYASFTENVDSIIIMDTSFSPENEGFVYKYRVRVAIPSEMLYSEWSDWGLEGWSWLPVLSINVYDEQDSLKVDTIKVHWDTSSFAAKSANKIEIRYGSDITNLTSSVLLTEQEQLDKGYLMLDAGNYFTIEQGKVFYFRAKIYRTEGTSEISSAFSAIDSSWYQLKPVEMSTMGLGEYADSIYVSWTPQASLPASVLSEMTYEIYRNGNRVDSVKNGRSTYYDTTNISEGSSFAYSIVASHKKFRKSPMSASAKGYAIILTPVMDTVEVGGNNLIVKWEYQTGVDIDSLYLYRMNSRDAALPEPISSHGYDTYVSTYSWQDQTCEKGKDYYYCVRAYKKGLALSDTSVIKSNYIELDKPIIESVSRGSSTSQIVVRWASDAYATRLSIMRDTLADFSTSEILDTVDFAGRAYIDSKNLQDGRIYYYKVNSIRGRFTSDTSDFVAGYTKYKAPAFSTIENNRENIQVNWNENGGSVDSVLFFIGTSVDGSSSIDSVQIGEKVITDLISKFTSPNWFVRGKEYYIRMKGISHKNAVMKEGNSAESFVVYSDFVASKLCYSSLQQPQIIATRNLLDTVKISWNRMDEDVVFLVRVEWKIGEFGTSGDTIHHEIGNNGEDTTYVATVNFSDLPLLVATKYNFRVKFYRGDISSEYSEVDTGWTKLSAPKSFSVSRGEYDDSLRFVWNNYLDGTDQTKDSTHEYILEYETSPGNYSQFRRISDRDSFYNVVCGLDSVRFGIETTFRVRGVSSANTKIDSVMTNLPTTTGWTRLLPPIYSATISKDLTNKIVVNWDNKLSDPTQLGYYTNKGVVYQIERRRSTEAFVGNGYQTVSPTVVDSFVDSSNLFPQYTYYYRVRYYSPHYYGMVNSLNKSISQWVEISDSGYLKLATPVIKVGIEGRYFTDSVLLSIQRVYGSDSLYLFRKAGNETNYSPVDTVIFPSITEWSYGAKNYYTDAKDVVSGQAYSYKAVALGNGRTSDTSNVCSTFTRLHNVTNVEATDATSIDSVVVTWDTTARAEFYDIRVENESGILLNTIRLNRQDSILVLKKRASGGALGILDYGVIYRFGVIGKNNKCIYNNDTLGTEPIYDKGYLKFVKPTITDISKDSLNKIKIGVSYPNIGFTFKVYRSPDTAYLTNTADQYDKYELLDITPTDFGDGNYQCVDYTSVTRGTNGIKYAYFIQALNSAIPSAISDSAKSCEYGDATLHYGYSKIDAYSGDFEVAEEKSTDTLWVRWDVPAIASKLDSIKYKWIEFKDGVAKDSAVVKTTQLVRDTSTNDRGIKYDYRIRLLAYDKEGDNYTTSDLSLNVPSSFINLDTPVVVVTRDANENNVISITNNSLEFGLFRNIDGVSMPEISVSAGAFYTDSVLYSNYYVGKHVSYAVKTYSTSGNLRFQSPESEAVDTYYVIYPPQYLTASAGSYEGKIYLNWAWGTKEKAHVDSFIVYRYSNDVLSKRIALSEDDIESNVYGDTLRYYDSDEIKQGVSYKYGICAKRVNTRFEDRVSDTFWTTTDGHATFSAPQNLTATKDAKLVTIKWDSIKNQGVVSGYILFHHINKFDPLSLWDTTKVYDTTVTQIGLDSVSEGTIRWYKVAAFNGVDTGKVSTSEVYGYALMNAPSNLNCWEAIAVDSIRVTWTKKPVYENVLFAMGFGYYIQQ